MKTILVLGATGRTGRSVLKHRPDGATVYAAVRHAGPGAPLPEGVDAPRVIDIEDQAGLSAALEGVDAVINAIRLRGDIAATALVGLHQSIVAARDTSRDLHVVHVGGAGSLRVGGGRRFWQAPGFPAATLPRGIGHARLRDYLEQYERDCRWAYLIPPPRFDPDGPFRGRYARIAAGGGEREFVDDGISYEDFAVALVDAVVGAWRGVWLIGGDGAPESP